jgi:hypothetical protein
MVSCGCRFLQRIDDGTRKSRLSREGYYEELPTTDKSIIRKVIRALRQVVLRHSAYIEILPKHSSKGGIQPKPVNRIDLLTSSTVSFDYPTQTATRPSVRTPSSATIVFRKRVALPKKTCSDQTDDDGSSKDKTPRCTNILCTVTDFANAATDKHKDIASTNDLLTSSNANGGNPMQTVTCASVRTSSAITTFRKQVALPKKTSSYQTEDVRSSKDKNPPSSNITCTVTDFANAAADKDKDIASTNAEINHTTQRLPTIKLRVPPPSSFSKRAIHVESNHTTQLLETSKKQVLVPNSFNESEIRWKYDIVLGRSNGWVWTDMDLKEKAAGINIVTNGSLPHSPATNEYITVFDAALLRWWQVYDRATHYGKIDVVHECIRDMVSCGCRFLQRVDDGTRKGGRLSHKGRYKELPTTDKSIVRKVIRALRQVVLRHMKTMDMNELERHEKSKKLKPAIIT